MDKTLIFTQLTLGMLGVLGVATSVPEAWLSQLLRVLLAMLITVVVSRLSPRKVVQFSPLAYVLVLLMLLAVLVVGISPAGSTSRRWLLIGNFTLQPSELMKVTVIAYLTAFFHNHLGDWQIWRPMLVIGLAAGTIVVEPDISTALFIFLLALTIMLAAGTSLLRLFSISFFAAMIALVMAGSYVSQLTYVNQRLMGFFDLWGEQSQTQGITYQANQARLTLVRAGAFGVGPGRPMRVPEAHTDMIAVSIGHALGLLGIITLFVLYFFIALRGMEVAAHLRGPGALLAAGATVYICGQAALNLLVASGLMPVTGIPLPFVSYGLNSLISVAIAMGFIHSSYRQARREGSLR